MPRMMATALLLAAALLAGGVAFAQGAPAYVPRPEEIEDLPAGAGRDETFALCAACHNYKLVSNQGQTRAQWDDTLRWMTERHNMPPIEGAERALILDYLAQHHGPKATNRAGGFRNPFAGN